VGPTTETNSPGATFNVVFATAVYLAFGSSRETKVQVMSCNNKAGAGGWVIFKKRGLSARNKNSCLNFYVRIFFICAIGKIIRPGFVQINFGITNVIAVGNQRL